MSASLTSSPPWTGADIDIGVRLAAILLRHAAHTPGTRLTSMQLLALARTAHPRDALLGRATPLGIAPKLAVVSAFCRQQGYPDLAHLVSDAAPGAADQDALNATPRAPHTPLTAAFDWAGVATAAALALPVFASAAHARVPARWKARAEGRADVAWYAYFRSHRAACEALSAPGKHEVINLIMAGLDPESALARVLAAQAAQAGAAP